MAEYVLLTPKSPNNAMSYGDSFAAALLASSYVEQQPAIMPSHHSNPDLSSYHRYSGVG